ncbi:thymidine kinase [Candidatus Phytoplasma sacchari]|uniref:Thymidine kinase n=1 Tax=Candidatus Phytoplasma sacchari TaxID=2609813 RepID=A0ABY7M196_9MOLU|nr:thymidine kinase [Candidatus Phytoplasma sacchari]KAB8122238.1 thymidine kinase [Candidatus Phytoplasma sacchari]WBL31486.1 thymidine kinase [Candidatus Phytoplasma sacchari]
MTSGNMGFIEVICGPMFAGKTTKLIEKIKLLQFNNFNFLVFKPIIDNRYSLKKELVTHDLITFPSLVLSHSKEILKFVEDKTNTLFIDEAQFFDSDIEYILNDLSYKGINIVISGLELDFCGRPFGSMPYFLSIADRVIKLKSRCVVCQNDASRTQRILPNGKCPDSREKIILVGSNQYHEPRCKKCHVFL